MPDQQTSINDYNNTDVACPRFPVKGTLNLKFTVSCSQQNRLRVNLTRQTHGDGSVSFTDGEFQYDVGYQDMFAYSHYDAANTQFRLKFFNFFRVSDQSHVYFTPMSNPLSFVGEQFLNFTVDIGNLTTSSFSGTRNEFIPGGRLYFEGGVYNRFSVGGLARTTRYANFIDFYSPVPQSGNAPPYTAQKDPLPIGAIVGIVVASVVVAISVINCCIKEKRRRKKAR
ncbi:hypothetical protein SpCBS45565_g04721 [Spizellomyces sp. 'palustris']|nr:hypothetical protein SpCBS45565_g04721 [Spizellomyces sp. 'palustris']